MTIRPASRALTAVLLLWGTSRLLLMLSGLAGSALLPSGRSLQGGNLQRSWRGPQALEIWARWDSEWYLLIAERGYHLEGETEGRRVEYGSADATGFFPLYPILVRALAEGLRAVPGTSFLTAVRPAEGAVVEGGLAAGREGALLLAGVLLSNLALLGSLLLLYERVHATSADGPAGHATPDRAALLACAALLVYPPSLFLSAVYPESLLLFLGLLSFRYIDRGRYWAASVAGALAAATKPSGLALIVPAAAAALGAATPPGRREGRQAAWLSLPVYAAGVAAFSLYCGRAFGDPLSWLHRQERWRGAMSGPWQAFQRWAEEPRIHGAHGSTVELILALLALALLAAVARRRPVIESLFAAAVVVPPLCATLWSFGRLSLQAFPLFAVLGCWAARRRGWSLAYFAPAAGGLAVLTAYYAAWWWAG